MKRALVILAVVLGSPAAAAFAQTTVSYNATVTAATNGVDAAAFPVGSSLVFSYTLNPGVADTNGDPSAGFFPGAVLSLSVSFPGLGISAAAGASGPAQTFDNADSGGGTWSDQVFFIGGPISSSTMLRGAPIDSVEVDFLSAFLIPPDEPTLLSSDALPLSPLNGFENFFILHTVNGSTFVHFTVGAAGPVVRVTANGADDVVTISQGSPLEVRFGFDAGAAGVLNPAQVYIGLITPFPPFVRWLNASGNFVPSAPPASVYSGPLPSFPLTPLFSVPSANLPVGSYYWFMFVDNDNNGVLNGTFHDFVQVIVGPPPSSSR